MIKKAAIWPFVCITFLSSASSLFAQHVLDSDLDRSIKQAIERDYRLRDAQIEVSASLGTITLNGTVTTFTDSQTAEQIAEKTVGVKRVQNRIRVDGSYRPDEAIVEDVRRRLAASSLLHQQPITVEVQQGVVTLRGNVDSWDHGQQAERVAREVAGVRSVRSQMGSGSGLSASTLDDDALRSEVESTLERDAYLAGIQFNVAVDESKVRLEGEVPFLFHRTRAGEQARSVAGVRSVDNQLMVLNQISLRLLSDSSDAEVRQVILDELKADSRISAEQIAVSARDGRIVLDGIAGSEHERRLAERVTREVIGVRGVDNQIQVAATPRSDSEIRSDLEAILAGDSLLDGLTIQVRVAEGTVTLTGDSRHAREKEHASRLAARVRGVRGIENDVKVIWSPSTEDETVRDQITSRMRSNALTNQAAANIVIAVRQGNVTLTGRVERATQKLESQRIAERTDGVRSVVNELEIK